MLGHAEDRGRLAPAWSPLVCIPCACSPCLYCRQLKGYMPLGRMLQPCAPHALRVLYTMNTLLMGLLYWACCGPRRVLQVSILLKSSSRMQI